MAYLEETKPLKRILPVPLLRAVLLRFDRDDPVLRDPVILQLQQLLFVKGG